MALGLNTGRGHRLDCVKVATRCCRARPESGPCDEHARRRPSSSPVRRVRLRPDMRDIYVRTEVILVHPSKMAFNTPVSAPKGQSDISHPNPRAKRAMTSCCQPNERWCIDSGDGGVGQADGDITAAPVRDLICCVRGCFRGEEVQTEREMWWEAACRANAASDRWIWRAGYHRVVRGIS